MFREPVDYDFVAKFRLLEPGYSSLLCINQRLSGFDHLLLLLVHEEGAPLLYKSGQIITNRYHELLHLLDTIVDPSSS